LPWRPWRLCEKKFDPSPAAISTGQPGARETQSALKAFYGVIKSTEASHRFVLITGWSERLRTRSSGVLKN